MDEYEHLGVIGEGTYGTVVKARHRGTGCVVAIKQFKEPDDEDQVRKTVEREVRVLRAVGHVNIVALLDVFKVKGHTHLVFEYVERTVLEALRRHPRGLGAAPTRRIVWQLVQAVQYLHSQKVPLLHRDIKPENMLLSEAGLLKLCDFGFARPAGNGAGDLLSDYVATRWYRSPELLIGDRAYGPPVDVWAIGCMAAEMETGQPLFPGNNDVDQLWLILKCSGALSPGHTTTLSGNPFFAGMRRPSAWELNPLEKRFKHIDAHLLEFLKACLHPDPAQRLTCEELLKLPYLADAEALFPAEFWDARARAQDGVDERAATAKLRKHKRKSAEMEPATAAISLTVSAHAAAQDAPRYRPGPAQRCSGTDGAAQQSPCGAAVRVSIRVQAEGARGSEQPSAAAPTASSTHEAAQERQRSSAQASSSQQQQQPVGVDWLSTRAHAPAGEGAAVAGEVPAANAQPQQQPAAAGARFQLPLTANQSRGIASHLQGCQQLPLPAAHQVCQGQYAFQPYNFQPLNIADWRPSQQQSTSQAAARPATDVPASTAMNISPERRQPDAAHAGAPGQSSNAARQLSFAAAGERAARPVEQHSGTARGDAAQQQQGRPAAVHPAKLAPLQPGKYAFAAAKPSTPKGGGGIMAVHRRQPGMQIQPPASSSALLASSVPATPQSPCNLSPSHALLRRKTHPTPDRPRGCAQGAPAAAPPPAAPECSPACGGTSSSRVDLPELHTLSTHCAGDAPAHLPSMAAGQDLPQLRRSQRKRAGVKPF